MNNFYPEDLLAIAKQRAQEEVANCLDRKPLLGKSFNRWLVVLGGWMVARGEKMQARQDASLQSNQMTFLRNKTRKFGA